MASIRKPITLIGMGRSGTTLIEQVFSSINGMATCGETAGIIFGTYAGALDSFFYSPFTDTQDRDVFASRIVRRLFLSLFPIEEANAWFHKPAGIPKMIPWERFAQPSDSYGFPTEWYWNTMNSVFPDARYLTVLRNPWDVVRSRMVFSGWPEQEIWEDMKVFYDILRKRVGDVDVVFFEDLVCKPEHTISALCSRLDLPVPANLYDVVGRDHVATGIEGRNRSHSDAWSEMKGPRPDEDFFYNVSQLWERLGRRFEQPHKRKDFFR